MPSRAAAPLRKNQIVSKRHRSGEVACYRVISTRNNGQTVTVEDLYLSNFYVRRTTGPNEGYRSATPADHAKAKTAAERWNRRVRDD